MVTQSLRELKPKFRCSLLSLYCNDYLFYRTNDEVFSGPGPFATYTVQRKNERYSAKQTTVLSNQILTSFKENYHQAQGIALQHSRGK